MSALMRQFIGFSSALLLLGPINASPIATRVDADRLQHDDRSGVTIFEGNVSLSRGSLLMKGDRLELRQMPDGSSLGGLWGKPARIRQQRINSQEWIEGEAHRIDYDSASQVSVLEGQASMKRLQGENLLDQVAGDRIIYNGLSEAYKVDSEGGRGRSRMTLMPGNERAR